MIYVAQLIQIHGKSGILLRNKVNKFTLEHFDICKRPFMSHPGVPFSNYHFSK